MSLSLSVDILLGIVLDDLMSHGIRALRRVLVHKTSTNKSFWFSDYIYEYKMGVLGKDARAANPQKEIASLYDYRTRIAQYRTDPDLSYAHSQFPWIPVWDGRFLFCRRVRHQEVL